MTSAAVGCRVFRSACHYAGWSLSSTRGVAQCRGGWQASESIDARLDCWGLMVADRWFVPTGRAIGRAAEAPSSAAKTGGRIRSPRE